MTIYWTLFLLPTIFYLTEKRVSVSVSRIFWVATAVMFVFVIGFRHEIGCDWYGYYSTYEALSSYKISNLYESSFIWRGPAFYFLTWVIGQTSLGFYGFNLICGIFFCWAVLFFSRTQPSPWMSCLIAVPYLLIVISMGYVRQSIAVGFLLFALTQLEQDRHWRYSILIFIGSLFHASLILFSPLMLHSLYKSNRLIFFLSITLIGCVGFYLLTIYGEFWDTYFSSESSKYVSSGALPRALMNAIPAGILLLINLRHPLTIGHLVWSILAGLSILSVVFVQTGSSGFDRLGVYLIPIQLYAWPRIIGVFLETRFKTLLALLIISIYAAYQYIWLNFSDHSTCWVPYMSIVF